MANASTGKGEKWYVVDASSKRVAPSKGNDVIQKQIQEVEKSALPAPVKAAAIAALKAEQANGKPFTLAVSRAQQQGKCDLIEVAGGFKAKQLSPRLLKAIVDNAAFVGEFLKAFDASDE